MLNSIFWWTGLATWLLAGLYGILAGLWWLFEKMIFYCGLHESLFRVMRTMYRERVVQTEKSAD